MSAEEWLLEGRGGMWMSFARHQAWCTGEGAHYLRRTCITECPEGISVVAIIPAPSQRCSGVGEWAWKVRVMKKKRLTEVRSQDKIGEESTGEVLEFMNRRRQETEFWNLRDLLLRQYDVVQTTKWYWCLWFQFKSALLLLTNVNSGWIYGCEVQ